MHSTATPPSLTPADRGPLPPDEELRTLQSELALARETADRATQARDHFIANMNHEIRTALAAILGYTEMMYDAKQSVTERLQCLGRIRQNAKSLTDLVDDLLDFSRLQQGQLEIRREDLTLADLMDETMALLQSQAWKKRLSLAYSFEGALPATVRTDPRRLRQVLLCLVGNAIKFTERGSVQLTVKLAGKPPRVEIEITDTGCGVTPEVRERLFEAFLPGELTMTRQFTGTGLGLAFARQLTRALGGELMLKQTDPGRGSSFVFTFDPGPVTLTAAAASPQPPPAPTSRLASPKSLDGMRILLVEDSRDIQALVAHFIRRSGAEVETAENGCEALRKAKATRYDVILMDLQMPVMNGLEATEQMREQGVGTPVVALTAHATPAVRERCFAVGCVDYLTKPLHGQKLLQLLRRFRRE